ncbi:MAG: (2Fe-2S) ferredoxin domain-containing protein [Polyangiales bacterium]
MPTRERYVWVCTNRRPDGHPKGSCGERGAESLKDALKIACAKAGLAPRVRVMHSGCIDLCERGVAVAVMPDDALLGGVTLDDVPELVTALAEGGVRASAAMRGRSIRDEDPGSGT